MNRHTKNPFLIFIDLLRVCLLLTNLHKIDTNVSLSNNRWCNEKSEKGEKGKGNQKRCFDEMFSEVQSHISQNNPHDDRRTLFWERCRLFFTMFMLLFIKASNPSFLQVTSTIRSKKKKKRCFL